MQTGIGPVGLEVPRDRAGMFEPLLVPKRSGRVSGGLDDMIISLYAHGMSVRDIGHHLKQVYGTELSAETVSRITDAVLEEVKAWQSRPLDPLAGQPQPPGFVPRPLQQRVQQPVIDQLAQRGQPLPHYDGENPPSEYALVARNLATDGIDVLWDFSRTSEGKGLMAGPTGQLVMREIVEDYLRYVEWADDDYPAALHLRSCQPSKVVIDPYRSFGQPFFEGSRARVQDVAAMLKAGEDPEVVAEEHGVSIDDVRTAARVLLGRAA